MRSQGEGVSSGGVSGGPCRAVVVVLLAAAAMVGAAGPAFAHSRLEGSDPPDGAGLDAGPARVVLTFDEDMPPGFDAVSVIGPDGKAWQDGEVTTSGSTVSVAVAPLGPAGRYQVGYRVVSADGHPVEGSTSFTLTKAGPGTPPARPAPATAGHRRHPAAVARSGRGSWRRPWRSPPRRSRLCAWGGRESLPRRVSPPSRRASRRTDRAGPAGNRSGSRTRRCRWLPADGSLMVPPVVLSRIVPH